MSVLAQPVPVEEFVKTLTNENTQAAYKGDLDQFLAFLSRRFATVDPLKISGEHIFAFMHDLEERNYSNASRARKLASLRRFFAHAKKQRWIQRNPVPSCWIRVQAKEPAVIQEEDVNAILAAVTGTSTEAFRNKAMIALVWDTGMQPTELCELDLVDVDVWGQSLKCRGRGDRVRSLSFTSRTRNFLLTYLQARRRLTRETEPALFVNHRGERITRQGFWLNLKHYAQKAEIPVDAQILRHSKAAQMFKANATPAEVQVVLGHAQLSSIKGLYRVMISQQAAAASTN